MSWSPKCTEYRSQNMSNDHPSDFEHLGAGGESMRNSHQDFYTKSEMIRREIKMSFRCLPFSVLGM